MCPINDDVDADIDKYGTLFDTDCANLLNDIIVATNANIVITSSWRQYLSLWQLRRMWKRRMMKGEIIGITYIAEKKLMPGYLRIIVISMLFLTI